MDSDEYSLFPFIFALQDFDQSDGQKHERIQEIGSSPHVVSLAQLGSPRAYI